MLIVANFFVFFPREYQMRIVLNAVGGCLAFRFFWVETIE